MPPSLRPPGRPSPPPATPRGRYQAPEPSGRTDPLFGSPGRVLMGAALCLGAGMLLARSLERSRPAPRPSPYPGPVPPRYRPPPPRRHPAQRGARLLHGGAAVLGFSSFVDSALEHHRGRFENRAMYLAPTVSGLVMAAEAEACRDPYHLGAAGQTIRSIALATGLTGLGFHAYNIDKRPGGVSLLNLFYAAPIGAPGAVALAGLFGRAAHRVTPGSSNPLHPVVAGRRYSALAGAALIGTALEAGLLHYRGAFQNPYMVLPVTLPPLSAAALGLAAVRPTPTTVHWARLLCGATAALGLAGLVFHAYGISRNMGGWGNWSQMIYQGPPMTAPPGFTGVALAGLGALELLENPLDG
ncbi:MAG: hypothetical protein R3310_10900 [Candidatus Competibacteraceae bacterium]|nr:hypothetical protein [Candidatus Competibacteraceae bacterium]